MPGAYSATGCRFGCWRVDHRQILSVPSTLTAYASSNTFGTSGPVNTWTSLRAADSSISIPFLTDTLTEVRIHCGHDRTSVVMSGPRKAHETGQRRRMLDMSSASRRADPVTKSPVILVGRLPGSRCRRLHDLPLTFSHKQFLILLVSAHDVRDRDADEHQDEGGEQADRDVHGPVRTAHPSASRTGTS